MKTNPESSVLGYILIESYFLPGITDSRKTESLALDVNGEWGQSYGCWQTEDVQVN
jgi:hypothetical protein